MTGRAAQHDGIRAETRPRSGLAKGYMLRVTASAKLARDETAAEEQRKVIAQAMKVFSAEMAEAGIVVEIVVGQPRSPDEIRASLRSLADGIEEPLAHVA